MQTDSDLELHCIDDASDILIEQDMGGNLGLTLPAPQLSHDSLSDNQKDATCAGEMQQQLTFIQTNLTELTTDNKELRKELKEDISALKGGMKEEFTALKGKITALSKDLNGLALKFTDDYFPNFSATMPLW